MGRSQQTNQQSKKNLNKKIPKTFAHYLEMYLHSQATKKTGHGGKGEMEGRNPHCLNLQQAHLHIYIYYWPLREMDRPKLVRAMVL